MKIILLKDVNNLGKINDIVDVKNGYAKNYLFPLQKALLATRKNIANINKNTIEQNNYIRDDKINETKLFDNLTIMIPVTTRNDDEMYGSINPQNLSKIFKHLKLKINLEMINQTILIKKTGRYKLEIINKKHNMTTTIFLMLIKANN